MLQAERPPATLQLRGRGAATAGAGSTANASNAEHRTRRESACVSCAALRARACYICLLHAYIECCVCILYAYMCCAARTARARNTANARTRTKNEQAYVRASACMPHRAGDEARPHKPAQGGHRHGWTGQPQNRLSPRIFRTNPSCSPGRRKRLEADGAHARADGAAAHRDQRRPVLRRPVQLRHRLHDGAAGAHPGRRGVKRPPPLPGAPPRGGHPLRHSRLRVRACSHGCLYRWRPLRPHPSILAPWRATG